MTSSGSDADCPAPLGTVWLKIGINDASYWANVPEPVWECRIGDCQVPGKWLSYRDHSVISHPLTPDEVAHT